MPRRDDLKTIMLIGSGPIIIGQACEFDYSGTQACKALREEGYRIVLINSNPATIMTDPQMADRTYVEPVTPEAVEKIIEIERPDALLPTLGGQTGLNVGVAVADAGVLGRYGVEMIGATREVIHRAEDRTEFKNICLSIGLDVPASGIAHSMDEARSIIEKVPLPVCIRPAYTLGGTGGGFAFNMEEFETIAARGLRLSPISEILIEESVLGWKEYELEVMRDKADNVVIVCSIENIDPMGVHTGDSITVAPSQTLTDKEYQLMRDAALAVIRAIGVETGGSNIQFAVDPKAGRMTLVEMNPRVSRSSALASKATGFPIAKIAAKLAVGYTLDELSNDITRQTPACFEPTIDYVVTKIPRWTFEKFPEADETLTTQMKSVGEGMSIGRTFKESLQKGIRSMEVKRFGLGLDANDKWLKAMRGEPMAVDDASGEDTFYPIERTRLRRKLAVPAQGRLYYIRYAMKMGWSLEEIFELTQIDPWYLAQFKELCDFEDELIALEAEGIVTGAAVSAWLAGEEGDSAVRARFVDALTQAKQLGYSDIQLASAWRVTPGDVRRWRQALGIQPVYKLVDTCAAEFEAFTPYYYSSYETPIQRIGEDGMAQAFVDDEIRVTDTPKIIILGGGPNRIGQGIEFDYCCVHAALAAREMDYESVMINSNPETVSTDYDTSDMLFFEPLTLEDVLNITERLNGRPFDEPGGNVHGVIVQFGGQTPLNLAHGLEAAGAPIIGTSPESIDLAEDRERFSGVLDELGLQSPRSGTAFTVAEAREVAEQIGYPVLVRPSYVLGGRAMEIVSDAQQLDVYMGKAVDASTVGRDHPILIDKFLAGAIEVDVDCVADFGDRPDGQPQADPRAVICGVMEHIEEAGVHSGDSSCALPPHSLGDEVVAEIKRQAQLLAERLKVRGLMNVQFAVKDGDVYILEVNPRASRTVPFVSKATGVSWVNIAAKVMAGEGLADLGVTEPPRPAQTSLKACVFPFAKFPGVDVILGPEMRSTGEVMGVDKTFGIAFGKSQMATGLALPVSGTVFVSVCQADKDRIADIVQPLVKIGYELVATSGTHEVLEAAGIPSRHLCKLAEGRPNVADLIRNGEIKLLINTPTRRGPTTDEGKIRALATLHNVPLITTLTGAEAAVRAMDDLWKGVVPDPVKPVWTVRPLQEYFPHLAR
ncbi:MAG: carbamoyl-phosphate synthase large subunit [Planctomycetota bacterium]|jgi:carbamoyl-phosphate synthase large subunit